MLRKDLDELVAAGRAAGLYSTLVTAGTRFTRERAEQLKAAGLDHVQVSIQSPDPEENDRIAGIRSFEKKIAAARAARELGFPLTINCVLHRQNLDRIEEILALAEELDAQRLELANTQYYGWAVVNQQALMPTREQLERGEEAVQRFRERVGPRITVLWVLPGLLRGPAEAVHGRLGADHDGDRAERRGAAVPGRGDDPRPRVPQRAATTRSSGSGTSRTRSRASAARTGCRSRAARARSTGRRRTSAAAAARRSASPATPRPPIPSAGSHRTTTTVVAAREPAQTDEFVYRTMKRPRLAERA